MGPFLIKNTPSIAVLLILALYSILSVPAPQHIGIIEGIIAGLVGIVTLFSVFSRGGWRLNLLELSAAGALGWLLAVPVVWGVMQGNGRGDMIRDVIPLLFLFLPALWGRARVSVPLLAMGVSGAGVVFGVRWWANAGPVLATLGHTISGEGRDYVLNSPAVLFAALYLPLWAVQRIGGRQKVKARDWALLAACLGLSLMLLIALAATVHRAALLMAALILGWGMVQFWMQRPRLAAVLTGALIIVLVLSPLPLAALVGRFWEKTQMVGLNARGDETRAVLSLLSAHISTLFLGLGWGGVFADPAVGGWRVSYTHAFASYMLLKTGVLGFIAILPFMVSLLLSSLRALRANREAVLAAMGAALMGFTVHTSFKYLCFGVILTIFSLGCRKK